ncbi:MAG: hypothetical protein QW416_04600 [Candidatus Nitrosocaldaceae archaeon]
MYIMIAKLAIILIMLHIMIKPIFAEGSIILSGTIYVFKGLSIDGGENGSIFLIFTDDDKFQLDLNAYITNNNLDKDSLITLLDGKYVTIEGEFRNDGIFMVNTISNIEPFMIATTVNSNLVGEQAWVTILAKFSDVSFTPKPIAYFDELIYNNPLYSLNVYWNDISYNNINIVGRSYGWYNLTNPQSYYTVAGSCIHEPRFDLLLDDMTSLVDSEVDFNTYDGINLVYNSLIGNCVWGGFAPLTRDGNTKLYSVTFLAYPALDHFYFAHEMGHGFGLDHSSGPYNSTYDSNWDVMSGNGCNNQHYNFGCISVGTISYHKAKLGWINSSKIYEVRGGSATIDLYPLDTPSNGYIMIKIPITDSEFYTIEYRRKVGFDIGIPDSGVIIHKVNENFSDRQARVVDIDNDRDPNDEGAIWRKGEVFRDYENGITITILEDDNPYKIGISVSSLSSYTSSFINNEVLSATFVLGDSNKHGAYGWGAMVNDLLGSIGLSSKLGLLASSGNTTQVLDTNIASYNGSVSINWSSINSNMVVIGGPGVNLLSYYYDVNRVLPFYLTWIDNKSYIHSSLSNANYTFSNNIDEDYAIIALINDNGRDILIVWGLSWQGTTAALQLLQHYDSIYNGMLDGSSILIRWRDNGNSIVDLSDTIEIVENL